MHELVRSHYGSSVYVFSVRYYSQTMAAPASGSSAADDEVNMTFEPVPEPEPDAVADVEAKRAIEAIDEDADSDVQMAELTAIVEKRTASQNDPAKVARTRLRPSPWVVKYLSPMLGEKNKARCDIAGKLHAKNSQAKNSSLC